ncbi:uncharacterized protein LOC143517493 [Brachyhypopomus gauderio]|uniref:uncharacterized protein LOC143517493 n=1 Tax=Brachyhypopomus gauderio TaxID=698409 RepID=UPI0040424912
MHSGTLDKTDSPKRRILSRGMSEEESLRHIIQEAEQTPKRLSRSDGRRSSLRRSETRDSQGEEEHAVTNTMELQANYEECLQELQTLELKQEVVLFQVDCLQDALLGAEEVLAETQREAHEIRMELEREKGQRRTLEQMVDSLTQEVHRVTEERNSALAELVKTREVRNADAVAPEDNPAVEIDGNAPNGTSLSALHSDTSSQSPDTADESAGLSSGRLTCFLKNIKVDPRLSRYTDSTQSQETPQGTSVDDDDVIEPEQRSEVDHSGQGSQQAGLESREVHQAQEGEENDESSGYEDARSEFPGSTTPDGLLDQSFLEYVKSLDEDELKNSTEPRSPRSQDSCFLS